MESQHQIDPFFPGNEGELAREIQNNVGRWMADTIPGLSSQSEHAGHYLTIIRRRRSLYGGVEGIIPQYSLSLVRIIVLV